MDKTATLRPHLIRRRASSRLQFCAALATNNDCERYQLFNHRK